MGGVAAERVCHALDRRRDGQITWTEFTALQHGELSELLPFKWVMNVHEPPP